MNIPKTYKNWVEKEAAFYDYIWKIGLLARGGCAGREMLDFKKIAALVLKKFPTKSMAYKKFLKYGR